MATVRHRKVNICYDVMGFLKKNDVRTNKKPLFDKDQVSKFKMEKSSKIQYVD